MQRVVVHSRGKAGAPAAPSRAAAGSSRCAGRSPRLRATRTCTATPKSRAKTWQSSTWQHEHTLCGIGGCMRLRLARRTAISMAPPQQSAPRIRAAYRAGGRRLSHFTHARSGSPQMVASGCDSMKSAIACRSRSGSAWWPSARLWKRHAPSPGCGTTRACSTKPWLSAAALGVGASATKSECADLSRSLVVAACRRRRTPGCLSANATHLPPAPFCTPGCSLRGRLAVTAVTANAPCWHVSAARLLLCTVAGA